MKGYIILLLGLILLSSIFIFSFQATTYIPPKSNSCSQGYCYIYGEDIKTYHVEDYLKLWFRSK